MGGTMDITGGTQGKGIDFCIPQENRAKLTGYDIQGARGYYLQDGIKISLLDAEKEFDQQCRIGFGTDGSETSAGKDFEAVRGLKEDNGFVQDIKQQIASLEQRVDRFKSLGYMAVTLDLEGYRTGRMNELIGEEPYGRG